MLRPYLEKSDADNLYSAPANSKLKPIATRVLSDTITLHLYSVKEFALIGVNNSRPKGYTLYKLKTDYYFCYKAKRQRLSAFTLL